MYANLFGGRWHSRNVKSVASNLTSLAFSVGHKSIGPLRARCPGSRNRSANARDVTRYDSRMIFYQFSIAKCQLFRRVQGLREPSGSRLFVSPLICMRTDIFIK